MKSNLTTIAVLLIVVALSVMIGHAYALSEVSERAVEILEANELASPEDIIYIVIGEKP